MSKHIKKMSFIGFTQTPPLNARAGVSSKARDIHFGLSLHLYPNCFVSKHNQEQVCLNYFVRC